MQRNKAVIIILIVAAIVIVALAAFYFYFMGGTAPIGNGVEVPISQGGNGSSNQSGGGQNGTTTSQQGGGQSGPGFVNQPQTYNKLRELSSLPVAGAIIFDTTNTFVRYMERGHGFIYETQAESKDTPVRISDTTIIPQIYEAYFTNKGQGVIVRYLKEPNDIIQTFYTSLKTTSSSTLSLANGIFLPPEIQALSVSPSQSKIFYLVQNGSNGAVGIVSNPDGSNKSQIFSSPLNEWLALWQQESSVTLFTKPSVHAVGYAYLVDSKSGAQKRVLGDIKGLTVLPNNDSSLFLYSAPQTGNFLGLSVIDAAKQSSSASSVATLPEKCVWSVLNKSIVFCAVPDSPPLVDYPDSWYRGDIFFSDKIEKINLKTGQTEIILDPQTLASRTMDITNLALSPKENYLLFTNKKDLTLWLLDLSAK